MSRTNQFNRIERLLERLDAAVVVRDPGNARSAEAFDGLRKSILVSSKNRRTHIAHLLSLADSIERGATTELLGERVNDFLFELGVKPLHEVTHPEMFEISEIIDGESDGYEVLQPAIVEQLESGDLSLIRLGKTKQIVGPPPPEPESPPVIPSVDHAANPPHSPVETPARWVRSAVLLIVGLLLGVIGHAIFFDSDTTDSPASTTIPKEGPTSSTSSSVQPSTTNPSTTTSTGD